MTLGLLTITHDEPEPLQRMLASVQEIIDGPTIATHIGEHDETEQILRDWGADVRREQWDDFDGSFNKLFQRAHNKADRFLLMGASHILKPKIPLPELNPAVPCYLVNYERGPYLYRVDNLLRGDILWSINAPVHGIIEPCFGDERQPFDAFVVYEDESNGRRGEKIARYLPICEKMVEDNPTPRAIFYLARTYFDVGRFEDAIEMYDRRIRMGGWQEEQWHAMYMRGVALIRLGRFQEGRTSLMAAYNFRPTRSEPLLAICRSMNPPGDDLLFVEHEAYAPQ